MEKIPRLYLLGIFLSSLVFGINGNETEFPGTLECSSNPADIVLILDSSRSIWGPDFKKMLEFVKDLVDQLDVGMGALQTRVGVMSFSNWAQIEINLDESTEKDMLKRKISRIIQLNGETNIADALRILRNEAFKMENGARSWVRHIGIIFTDGQSQSPKDTQIEAQACKDANVTLFAIGIGNRVSIRELRGIASHPKSEYFMHYSNYNALTRIRSDILQKTCKVVIPTSTTTQTSPSRSTTTPIPSTRSTTTVIPSTTTTMEIPIQDQACKNKVADIYFLLDSSSSIRIDEFQKQVNVIEDIVAKFDIGPSKVRVGVSVFSHEYYPKLRFDDATTKEDILKIIGDIKYLGGGTKIGKALHEMRTDEFNSQSLRDGVDKIVVLFTDGRTSDQEQASFESKQLKESGVKLFVIGIGPFIDQIELEDIASRPSEDYVYTFETFDELLQNSGLLSKKTCTVKDQILVREQEVCNATQMTDVMFMVSDHHFGKEKTDRILKASAEVIRRTGSRGAFRFGTLFEECLPKEGMKIGSVMEERQLVNDIVSFQFGSLSSLIRQLRIEKFSQSIYVRKAGLLFLDKTIELDDPQIQIEVKRALFKEIHIYAIIVGDGVDIAKVERNIAPRERIIFIKSYDKIVSSLPFRFTNMLCTTESTTYGPIPGLS